MLTPGNGRVTELLFTQLLEELAPELPEPVEEWRFCSRRWRFDYAWPERMVAVEIDGGQYAFAGGRHNTDADRDKINTAESMGYHVLRFSHSQLRDDPKHCIDLLRLMLG